MATGGYTNLPLPPDEAEPHYEGRPLPWGGPPMATDGPSGRRGLLVTGTWHEAPVLGPVSVAVSLGA